MSALAVVLGVLSGVLYVVGFWRGRRVERRLTAHLFEEGALEHERLTRTIEAVRRQLAAAVVRAADGP